MLVLADFVYELAEKQLKDYWIHFEFIVFYTFWNGFQTNDIVLVSLFMDIL